MEPKDVDTELEQHLQQTTEPPECYPPALQRACHEEADYVLQLTTGEVVEFQEAFPIDERWVTIAMEGRIAGHSCPRVDLKVTDVVWVADDRTHSHGKRDLGFARSD
jgi:hypothetical protein